MEWADLVGDFLDALKHRDREKAQQIVGEFWKAFGKWIYGAFPPDEEPQGVLGAVLRSKLGLQKARQQWVLAMQRLEEQIFTPEGFQRSAEEFDSSKGNFFQFFKQWILWRALEVAEQLKKENPSQGATGNQIDVFFTTSEAMAEQSTAIVPALPKIRDWLEEYCHQPGNRLSEAQRKVAAFELKYKAYWPLEEMTFSTRQLLAEQLSSEQLQTLGQQYYDCCVRYKQLTVEIEGAFRDLRQKENELWHYQAQLYRRGERDLGGLEQAACGRKLEELRAAFARLPPQHREDLEGLRLQYEIAWIRWAKALRKHQRLLLEEERYQNCRHPWIRAQGEIAVILGISQPSVHRYQQEVCKFLQSKFG